MSSNPSTKPKLNRVKRSTWPNDVISCSFATELSDDGWYISCKVCKQYGHPIGKYRIKMRHAFSSYNFFNHITNTAFHKKALLSFDDDSQQTSLSNFFQKRPRVMDMEDDNVNNESLSTSTANLSRSTLQDLVISCDGIYSSKEDALAKKVISLCLEFVSIPSTSCYEFSFKRGYHSLRHKDCHSIGKHKLSRSNPVIYQCSQCQTLRSKKGGSNPKNLLVNRYHTYQKAIDRRSKPTLTHADVIDIQHMSRINPIYCTEEGKHLIDECSAQLQFVKELQSVRKKLKNTTIFESIEEHSVLNVDPILKKLSDTLKAFPEYKDSLLMCLLRASIVKLHQKKNLIHCYSHKVINFFQLIRTHSPKCADVVSANLFGPSKRYIQKINSKEDIPSVILGSRPDIIKAITDVILTYQAALRSKVSVSLAVDATKLAQALQVDSSSQTIVGGCFPLHRIDISSLSSDEVKSILNQSSSTYPLNLASEIKVGVLSFQKQPKNAPPFIVIAARPQGNNEQSDFLSELKSCVEEACQITNDNFLNFSVDGVSIESNHVRQSICDFFSDKCSYIGTTDSNHNAKSIVYQIIGGSNLSYIGKIPIDADLLRLADITQELWRTQDFASDLVVLKLASSETIDSLLKLPTENYSYTYSNLNALMLTLYFIRLRLYSINGSYLLAKHRVRFLWSSTLWLISISGVSIVTKRNLISEMISMSCIILRKDVFRPRALTTESAEHQFGIYRSMIHEFTTLEFMQLHRRSVIRLNSLLRGKLNHSREASKGYQATFNNFLTQPIFYEEQYGCNGLVECEINTETNLSDKIWSALVPIINTSVVDITDLLKLFSGKPLHKKFLSPMQQKSELINAYLDISPQTFIIQHPINNVNTQDNTVDLNERMFHFVNDLLSSQPIDENDINITHSVASTNNSSTSSSSNKLTKKKVLEDNQNLLNEHLQVLATVNSNNVNHTSKHILKAMRLMEKSNKQQGSISSERKYKSLNARWMSKPSETTILLDNELIHISPFILQRDVVVKIKLKSTSNDEGTFRILGVYTKFYNKWYINPNPKTKKDYQLISWNESFPKGKVKLSVRMIMFDESTHRYIDLTPISISQSQQMFRMIDACDIKSYSGKLN